jgi:hypothetical protein
MGRQASSNECLERLGLRMASARLSISLAASQADHSHCFTSSCRLTRKRQPTIFEHGRTRCKTAHRAISRDTFNRWITSCRSQLLLVQRCSWRSP